MAWTLPSLAQQASPTTTFRLSEQSEGESALDPAEHQRIDALLNSAAEQQARGQVRQAFNTLEEVQRMLQHRADPVRNALVLGRLSDGYLLARRLADAMDYAKQSVTAARGTGNSSVLATAFNHLGNVHMARQRYTAASEAFQQGIDHAKRSADPRLEVTLLTNAVHAHLADGAISQAIATLRRALDKLQPLPASTDKAFGLLSLGYLAQRVAVLSPADSDRLLPWAYRAFVVARKIAVRLDDIRTKSYALGHLGELYVMTAQHSEGQRLLNQALFLAIQNDAPEQQARWHWQMGRSLRAQRKTQAAKAAYRKAVDGLASIRSALVFGQRGNPQFFRETVGTIYLELAAILLEESKEAKHTAQRQKNLREVREVMESFKAAELQNYFQDGCVTVQQERFKARAVDTIIGQGTATLYPIVFPDRLLLLLSLAEGEMHSIEVAVTVAELRRVAKEFRQQITQSGHPRRLRKFGLMLYKWLIQPLVLTLTEHAIDTLVLVPEGALRTIPFAALYDGEEFLIDRYALAVTPGLTLTDSVSSGVAPGRALVSGLSESVQGFADLPHVGNEMQGVASLYRGTLLVNKQFLKPRVAQELQRGSYNIISFATHAQIHSDPRQSFLLTYDGRITLDELEDLVRIEQFSEQPIELMVLSACDTAVGDERAALGLAGVAVKAGVRSVMASLWAVNDASTAELVTHFFEHLKDPALSKAKALQRAQQQLLTENRYRHPFHWAPFVLIGNWQ